MHERAPRGEIPDPPGGVPEAAPCGGQVAKELQGLLARLAHGGQHLLFGHRRLSPLEASPAAARLDAAPHLDRSAGRVKRGPLFVLAPLVRFGPQPQATQAVPRLPVQPIRVLRQRLVVGAVPAPDEVEETRHRARVVLRHRQVLHTKDHVPSSVAIQGQSFRRQLEGLGVHVGPKLKRGHVMVRLIAVAEPRVLSVELVAEHPELHLVVPVGHVPPVADHVQEAKVVPKHRLVEG
mmetsp:Transcript_39864/g.89327  ORF Transcript_39864/g.89327 Transcript_39864/m.89327 type:complete len:236 (+) Transcript_39864:425-1132(+)